MTLDSFVSIKGFVETRLKSDDVLFGGTMGITDSDFDVEFDAALSLGLTVSIGPKVNVKIYDFTVGVDLFEEFVGELAFEEACKYKFNATKAQIQGVCIGG